MRVGRRIGAAYPGAWQEPLPRLGRFAAADVRRLRRHARLHSARADRMTENIAVMPNPRSVHKKKKASPELPMSPRVKRHE